MSDTWEVEINPIVQEFTVSLGDVSISDAINDVREDLTEDINELRDSLTQDINDLSEEVAGLPSEWEQDIDGHAGQTSGVHGITLFGASLVGAVDADAAKEILDLDDLVIDDSNYGKLNQVNNWQSTGYWGITKRFLILPDWTGFGELGAGSLLGTYGNNGGSFSFFAGIDGPTSVGAKVAMGYASGNGTNVLSAAEVANVASGYSNLILMKSGGNVLVGTSTHNGSSLLQVNGEVGATTLKGSNLTVLGVSTFDSSATFQFHPDAANNARTGLGLRIGQDVQAYDVDLDAWAGKTAPSGTVVGTNDVQTISNKTFTAPALGTPVSGNFSTGSFTWPTFNQSTTGSAATLTTPRTINGVSFNGSANIGQDLQTTASPSFSKVNVTSQVIFGADSSLSRTGSASFTLGNATAGNALGSLALGSLTASAGLQGKNLTLASPTASITPANNGDWVIEATSNTSTTFKYKGSDGVVRSGTLLLGSIPTVASFSAGWINQNNRTIANVTAPPSPGLTLRGTVSGAGTGIGLYMKPLSGNSTWTYRARLEITMSGLNYNNAGLALRDSVSGKIKTYSIRWDNAYKFQYLRWDSAITFNAITSTTTPLWQYGWSTIDFRLTNNGTNIIFDISYNNGLTWTIISTEAIATFTTQNQVGVYIDNQFSEVIMVVKDWEES